MIRTDGLPIVTANSGQLALVFQNLIANAIKFQKEDVQPHIRISAENQDDVWQFSVCDNGIGMDSAFFDKIYHLPAVAYQRKIFRYGCLDRLS